MTNLSQDKNQMLQECIRFHGHFCPGLSIGFQAAGELMRILRVEKAGDEELFAIVETDACGADAIQVLTGCTFGKGNFFFRDYGKHAFTLGSRKQNKAVRASLRSAREIFDSDFVSLFNVMQSKSAIAQEKSNFLQLREKVARRILDMEIDKLFTMRDVAIEFPPRAPVVLSEVCPKCNEPVRFDYLQDFNGTLLCPSCREISSNKK
jgi:formylmethanofuran dehydrogenase subunit E